MDWQDPYSYVQLTSIICTFVAVVTTFLRLFVRRVKLLMDDVCASLSMTFLAAQLGVILVPRDSIRDFTRSYLIVSLFYATVWSARLSMLFTIIRIGSEQLRHRLLAVIAVLFVLFFSILLAQLFWVCEPQRHSAEATALAPRSIYALSCMPTKQMGLLQICFDAFADLTLVLSSLRLFLIIGDKPLRYRLIFLFSTCLFTTAISAVHVYLVLTSKGIKIFIAALVEGSVSLIVSSLPVVTNLFVRIKERTRTTSSATRFSGWAGPGPVSTGAGAAPQPLTITFATDTVPFGSVLDPFSDSMRSTTPSRHHSQQAFPLSPLSSSSLIAKPLPVMSPVRFAADIC